MDLQSLQRRLNGMATFLVFLIAWSCNEASAFHADEAAVQYPEFAVQLAAQHPLDIWKTTPAVPKDYGGVIGRQPIRIDNPVACYSGCVIGCNPHHEGQEQRCQQRCAGHCWKK